jgi:DNA-binding IclR family transcriptional regulator
MNTKKSDIIPNLERALHLLEYLHQADAPKGVSDVSKALEFPKNTVFRIMNTLERNGYITRNKKKKYSLSGKISYETAEL